MNYVCLTTTDADAISLMNGYGASLLSTQPTFLVWLWTPNTQDDLTTLQQSDYCISFIAVN